MNVALVGCQNETGGKANSTESEAESHTEVNNQGKSTNEESHNHSHDHDHNHGHDEETQKIADGYFEENEVKERQLSDWEGDWQSLYPYLKEGSLDQVFAHKAEKNRDKTEAEYKEYYNTAYETDVNQIVIEGNQVTFFENGQQYKGVSMLRMDTKFYRKKKGKKVSDMFLN